MTPRRIFQVTVAALALTVSAIGQSIPSFAPPVSFPARGASAVASGDFNGDGKVDVVTANGIATGSHGVSILLSNGDGSFRAPRNFATGSSPTMIAVGDFNADGKLDVAVADGIANSLSILLGNGDGTLRPATTIGLPGTPLAIFAADFNADGKKDLAVALNTGAGTFADAILLSNGDGTFRQSIFSSGFGLAVGDVNGDGKQDLIVFGLNTPIGAIVKFGNGDGTFTDSVVPFSTSQFTAQNLVVGDFNGDGKMDFYAEIVARGSRGAFEKGGFTALGNGDGSFTFVSSGGFAIGGQNLLVGDFNRDGKLDVAGVFPGPFAASLGVNPPPTIQIRYGAGDGTLASPLTFAAGPLTAFFTSINALVSGDFDGNGAPDFAWVTGSGINVVRNANGNPPLLSNLSLGSSFVVGGVATVSGTLTIGDPAPAGGAVIALASSNPAAAFFPGGGTATIPAGATSTNFSISTGVVATPQLVTITGSWNGVNQVASFHVDPAFSVSAVTFKPASAFGLFGGLNGVFGTVNLSGPASDGGATISLASSNPALITVPASVTIPAGVSSTPTSSILAQLLTNVAANTPVTISATYQGGTKSFVVTVLKASDKVVLTKAEWVVATGQWKIEATGTNATATIYVLNPAGQFVGALVNQGGGTYKGQGFTGGIIPPPFTTAVLQSTKGGFTSGPVTQR